MPKKIFLFFSFIFILILVSSGLCFAQRALEITYPEIPILDFIRPTTVKALLPEYIKYIFGFALMIAGLIAFGSLIYGGVRYLTSAGSPSVLGDAKDQIFSAILGLVILLCSYLILTTVNPQLVKLTLEGEPIIKGIVIYKDQRCGKPAEESANDFSESLYKELESEGRAMKINSSASNLKEFLGDGEIIKSIYFFESADDLRVLFYDKENWEIDDIAIELVSTAETCAVRRNAWIDPSLPCALRGIETPLPNYDDGWKPCSIGLFPQAPGVYLCDETYDGEVCGTMENPGKETLLQSSLSSLPEDLDNKVEGLRLKSQHGIEPGAVLHKDANYQGAAELFLENEPDLTASRSGSYRTREVRGGVSSVTVFTLAEEGTGEVIFYEEENYGGDYYKCDPSTRQCCAFSADGTEGPCIPTTRCQNKSGDDIPDTMCINDVDGVGIAEESINSIIINGNYMVMLFDGRNFTKGGLAGLGKGCTIFAKENDKDFVDNPIGRCGCVFGWGCHSCLSSFIILPIR